MRTFLSKILNRGFDINRLPKDDIALRKTKGVGVGREYIAINLAYKEFQHKKRYPISLRLVFHKSGSYDEATMSSIEFQLRSQILNKGGLIFICRKDRTNTRELIFYISEKSLLSVNAFSILKNYPGVEDVEIILQYDKNWIIAELLLDVTN